MVQKIGSAKCFLVRMRYSAFNRKENLYANQFFNQYVEAGDISEVHSIALRVLAQKISERFNVPLGNVDIVQLNDMRVIKVGISKCAESKLRAQKKKEKLEEQKRRENGPFQMKLPFTKGVKDGG